jgi:hypothetical protein
MSDKNKVDFLDWEPDLEIPAKKKARRRPKGIQQNKIVAKPVVKANIVPIKRTRKAAAPKSLKTRINENVAPFDINKPIHRSIAPFELKTERSIQQMHRLDPELKKKSVRYIQSKSNKKVSKSADLAEGMLQPGIYSLELVIDYFVTIHDWSGKNDVLLRRNKKTTPMYIVIKKRGHLWPYAMKKATQWMTENYRDFSEWQIIGLLNVNVLPITSAELRQRRLKGTSLAYKFLGNLQTLEKNPGQCVIDYLLNICQTTERMKHWTRPQLTKYFGDECVENGISTDQIIEWAKSTGHVNVYALDPFKETFASHKCDRTVNIYCTLCFIVNNDHLYAIIDPELVREAATKNRIDLGDFQFNVNISDHFYAGTTNPAVLAAELHTVSQQVILSEMEDLCEVAQLVIRSTNKMIEHTNFMGSQMTGFQHPETGHVILSASGYKERKHVADMLLESLHCDNFVFKNQSWTQLALDYFNLHYGNIPKSQYGIEYQTILDQHKIGAYITLLCDPEQIDVTELVSFDIRRDYTSILIENDVSYPVFSDFDHIEPYTGQSAPGEYYISVPILMGNDTIKLSPGWYPYVLSLFLLEEKLISHVDITYVILASGCLAPKHFSEFASNIYNQFTEDGSKQLINCFIGELNKGSLKKTKGCVTDSYEIAMGIICNEKEKGRWARPYMVGDLYFVRSDVRTQLHNGHRPIWRHLIAASQIKLHKLHQRVCGPDTIVVAYNTDSIKVINPLPIELADEPYPGDIRKETSLALRGTSIHNLIMRPVVIYPGKGWNECLEDISAMKGISCLITGRPGSGKTEMAKTCMIPDKTIAFAWTNRAVDELRLREVENVHTFDSYFPELQGEKSIRQLARYDMIIVDEFSMVPKKFFSVLLTVRRVYPNIIIHLYGDVNQCKPVEDRWIAYMKSPLIMQLVNSNLIILEYKFTRYDVSLNDVLEAFLANSKLPESCATKRLTYCEVNVCKLNTTRVQVNAGCLERFISDHPFDVYELNETTWVIGMPVICNDNSKEYNVYRSQIYKIKSIGVEETVLIGPDDEKIIPNSILQTSFEVAFCVTVYKYQGSTIRENYNIWDVNKMTHNELYTAMSRGISLDKVHFNYTNKVYVHDVPETKCIKYQAEVKTRMAGKIYIVSNGDWVYVGSTCQTLEERLKEHIAKPVNKEMAKLMMDEDVNISLCQEVPVINDADLLAVEDQWIKKYQAEGRDVKNVKLNLKQHKPAKNIIQVVQQRQMESKKYKITDDVKSSAYRIQWREDGVKKEKKWRYKQATPEEKLLVYEEARAFQKSKREADM